MTTYTAIPGTDIDTDSPITESLMTKLRDNPIAITEGASGAPTIQNAAIAASAVHTAELNTSTGSTSTTSAGLHFDMTGGAFVFAVQTRISNASHGAFCYGETSGTDSNPFTQSTSFVTRMAIGSSNAASTAYAQYRYVAASPPHDMGDGDIPVFIFAIIDNGTGDVESISTAADPVWLANGPTNAMPTVKNKSGSFKRIKEIPDSFAKLTMAERAIAISELPDVEIKITEAIKHADMDIIPHPFTGNDLSNKTVVLLDPVSDVVRQISVLEGAGDDIHKIIRDKHVLIGNTPLNRAGPKDLIIPGVRWKS